MRFRVIAQRGQAALVEWSDVAGLHRSIIPLEQVHLSFDIDYAQLTAGIPFGVAWEEIDFGPDRAVRIAEELRRHGIWTRDDLQRKLPTARAVLIAVAAQDLTRLIDGARRAAGGVL